jgi:WD40 repeat protein
VKPRFRIFVSSPSDVKSAREIAALTIERLAQDYARFLKIEPYLWEFEAMIASGQFQDSIEPPSAFDIVLLILWSRLGTLLPQQTAVREYRGIDGRAPLTGTEWEFEEALQAARSQGAPDLLVYRSLAPASFNIRNPQNREEQLRQLESLERFWARHFVDKGLFLGAYTTFGSNAEFAVALESHLRKLIERRISALAISQGETAAPVWAQAPFRGLEAYDFEHAPIFFGQDEALSKAMLQLTANAEGGAPFLLVLGASGSGKSSVVKAGIVPKLFVPRRIAGMAFLRRVVFRPSDVREGEDLFDALARRLTTQSDDEGGLPELIGPGQSIAALAAHLRNASAAPAYPIATALGQLTVAARQSGRMLDYEIAKLALVVDQLEELFTDERVLAAERIGFVDLLIGLVKSGLVWVVATMRKDFWHRADETPELVRLAEGSGRLELLPPAPSQLSQIIRRPAEASGIKYEIDHTTSVPLNEVISEEVAREPGALPLLSYLLDQLYQRDILEAHGNTLTYATYESLGRLEGAIATQAEAVLARCAAEDRAVLGSVLFSLVQMGKADGNIERAIARRVPLSTFPPNTPQRRLVEALLNPKARLLVSDSEKGGHPTVRVAHEALISRWSQARDFVQANAEALKIRYRVEERYALWRAIGEQTFTTAGFMKKSWRSRFGREQGLLSDIDLTDGRRLLKEHRSETEPHLVDYIERSVADDRRARSRSSRVLSGVVAVVTLLALAATLAGFAASRKQHEAEQQALETMKAQSRLLTEAAGEHLRRRDVPYAQGIILEVLTNPGFAASGSPSAIATFQEARAADHQLGVLWGHGDRVASAHYSPDGTRIVTCSADNTARIWDAFTGVQLRVLRGHDDSVVSARYSPDGAHIVTASHDKTARIWDAQSGAQVAVLQGHDKALSSAAYSPDGTRIVTASSDKSARVWDALTARQLKVITGHEAELSSALYSPDGLHILTASADNTARVWDLRTGNQIAKLTGHSDLIFDAEYSPDGKHILTASRDKSARVWDARSGAQLAVLSGHREDVLSAAYSPDGTQILTASFDQTARLWDGGSFETTAILAGHDDALLSAAYSPDGTRIVTTSFDKSARIWKAHSSALTSFRGHGDAVFFAAYSPDGTRVVTASNDRTARIWDVATGRLVAVLTGHESRVCSAVYSTDGKRIVTSSLDGTARIWDSATGKQLLVVARQSGNVVFAAYSPDNARVVTASDDKIARIWDSVKGTQLLALAGHDDALHSAVYSPDGARIITTSFDKTARVWDSHTGKQIMVLSGHADAVLYAAYSRDGKRIVTTSNDYTARTWDATTGAQLAEFIGHGDSIGGADFSPDGQRIVTSSDDQTARVWDAETATQLAVFAGHEGGVNSVAYSPDGKHLVTGANDNTAMIWDAEISAPVPAQILWEESAQFEQLPQTQRIRYGLQTDPRVKSWPDHKTACDQAAGAFYDPDRVAPGVVPSRVGADVANAACSAEIAIPRPAPRSNYEFGRALLMKGDFQGARKQFETSASAGYRVAQVDLGNLLINTSAGMLDPERAAKLYETAWDKGVAIAAFSRGQLYEPGDAARALAWYQKGADAAEPYALARLAEHEEMDALAQNDASLRRQMLLHAFSHYALAAERAHDEDWPDDAWKQWRYRRGTLARELARQGMMQQVADANAAALARRVGTASTLWKRIEAVFRLAN